MERLLLPFLRYIKILPIEKPLGTDENLIKSVWETEGNEPSPPNKKVVQSTAFLFCCRKDLNPSAREGGRKFVFPKIQSPSSFFLEKAN